MSQAEAALRALAGANFGPDAKLILPSGQELDSAEAQAIIVPLNPVVPGHVIAIPTIHVVDAGEKPLYTGDVMADISRWAESTGEPYNLITSSGVEATQSVRHLHIHYVPRHSGDGLALSWTGQVKT